MIDLFLKLLVLYALFELCFSKTVICESSKSIILNEDEIVFIESPNFPKPMNKTIKEQCKLNVTGAINEENMRLVFVITNGHFPEGQIDDGQNITEFNTRDSDVILVSTSMPYLEFSFTDVTIENGTDIRFQGYVIYETVTKNHCPLSNKKIPYIFTNESEVLHLRTTYSEIINATVENELKCVWKFISPEGYGFKIDVVDNTAKLLVVSNNNSRSFISRELPYFYNGKEITIAHTAAYNNGYIKQTYFSALISIVPEKNTLHPCSTKNESDKTIWGTSFHGYTSNINCEETIPLLTNHQLYAQVILFEQGKIADILRYYDDEALLHPSEISISGVYVFFPHEIETKLTWTFTSEEDKLSKGFRISFESVECNCADEKIIIPCNGNRIFNITKTKSHHYCVNMTCPFVITMDKSCPNNYASLELNFNLANKDYDNFQLLSDGEILINVRGVPIDAFKRKSQVALISPNRTTTLNFKSFTHLKQANDTLDVGRFTLVATPLPAPSDLEDMIVYAQKPADIIIDSMPKNSKKTIKLSPELLEKNGSLRITYRASDVELMLQCVTLYDNKDLTSLISLPGENISIVVGPTITIYKHINCQAKYIEFLIKAESTQTTNCIFQNTVIYIPDITKSSKKVTMAAMSNKECELILLSSVPYLIKNVWTNSKNENILIYDTSNITDVLFEFNYNKSKNWQPKTFTSLSYTIKIPPSSNIILDVSILGFDTYKSVTKEKFRCLANEGFSLFVGRIYRSLGYVDLKGIQNIINARSAGFKFVQAFIFPCLRKDCVGPKEQIDAAINATIDEGAEIDIFWLDIQIHEWPEDKEFNQRFILEIVRYAEARNVKVGIYTNLNNWKAIVGRDWDGVSHLPLWYAHFDKKDNFDDFKNVKYGYYGGWIHPSMKQFQDNVQTACDIKIDYDYYLPDSFL